MSERSDLDRPCAHCRRYHDHDDQPVCNACWNKVPRKLRDACDRATEGDEIADACTDVLTWLNDDAMDPTP